MKTLLKIIFLCSFFTSLYAQEDPKVKNRYYIEPGKVIKFYGDGDNNTLIYLYDTQGLDFSGNAYLRHFLKYSKNTKVKGIKTHVNTTVISLEIERNMPEPELIAWLNRLQREIATIKERYPNNYSVEIEKQIYAHKLTIWKKKGE
jgi:hypothetical protein